MVTINFTEMHPATAPRSFPGGFLDRGVGETAPIQGGAVDSLRQFLIENEEWLMDRVLRYASLRGYTRYASTLREAWRLSIHGLSESLLAALSTGEEMETGADVDWEGSPAAAFGVIEAKRHRERGISLDLFMGLMKYYRRGYLDLVGERGGSIPDREGLSRKIDGFFDRVEIAFCLEWTRAVEGGGIPELQDRNRLLTNEKNRFLTIFESIPVPVLLISPDKGVQAMNHAAAALLLGERVPGAWYYREGEDPVRSRVESFFPRFGEDLDSFMASGAAKSGMAEWTVSTGDAAMIFHVTLSRMLDVSGKFDGTLVILDDLTESRRAAQEREHLIAELTSALACVRTLSGLLPICASCKKIRDDKGYWSGVESYIQRNSDAQFSHSICPDCMTKLYPEYTGR
jgi:PAS domain-containing protein